MSKSSFCYPYSIHSTRVAYILNNGTFVEDTAIFCIKESEKEAVDECCLFKNINIDGSDVICKYEYENRKIKLETYFRCGFCKSVDQLPVKISTDEKIEFNHTNSIICQCNKSCIIIESQINLYRKSDFKFKQPYEAPYAAAIFGLFVGIATAFIFGTDITFLQMEPYKPPNLTTPIATGLLTLGDSGVISSFINTNNNGSLTVSIPSLIIGDIKNRFVNKIGIPIDLKDSDYQRYSTNTSKEDLINKLKNQSLDSVKAQYPRLFKIY